jgi:hypothetical protein
MKLTSSQFKQFIHAYKSLPEAVLNHYDYTPKELPTEARKKAFTLISKNYRAMEMWLRYLLLNETEYRIDLQTKSLLRYRPFAYQQEKFYKLIQAIEMSELTQKRFPSIFEQCNSEELFFVEAWQGCEQALRDAGILGNNWVIPCKSHHYKLAKLIHAINEDPRPGRLFQRNDAGKLVNTETLKESELKPPHFFELQDSTEPIELVWETRHWDSPFFMVMDIARSVSADFCVADAMSAFTKAAISSARAIQSGEYQFIAVIGDSLFLGTR